VIPSFPYIPNLNVWFPYIQYLGSREDQLRFINFQEQIKARMSKRDKHEFDQDSLKLVLHSHGYEELSSQIAIISSLQHFFSSLRSDLFDAMNSSDLVNQSIYQAIPALIADIKIIQEILFKYQNQPVIENLQITAEIVPNGASGIGRKSDGIVG
jgi:hypothetical protein